MPNETYNLFIYGTLMNPVIFRAVLGRRLVSHASLANGQDIFLGLPAVLDGYKKVSPDSTYLYAVRDRGHRIRGYLVENLPRDTLPALMKYEGRNYNRKSLPIQTAEKRVKAYVFVGNEENLKHSFGWAFKDELKQEFILQEKFGKAIRLAEQQELKTNQSVNRRTIAELSGHILRDLTRQHFEVGGISDFAIRESLRENPVRNYKAILEHPHAEELGRNYLRLVIRQVIFNEFEDRIRREFRYELDHLPQAGTFHERSVSSLIALRVFNLNTSLNGVVENILGTMPIQEHQLIDFVRHAIIAADTAYNPEDAREQLEFVRSHMGFGNITLGAELEFSNIGHDVIRNPNAKDPIYDGFLYFHDFALDALTWRLGGHIDNHRWKTPGRPTRGFFEVALGNISIEANLSKPITRDPWVLNQLIQQTRRFFEIIQPHSVHISMQPRSQHRPDTNRLLPLSILQCLFAIAGDPTPNPETGQIQIRRLVSDEIIRTTPKPNLLFSEIRKRFSRHEASLNPGDSPPGLYVQQFRFLRLDKNLNYEPIIMALKGIQLSLRPGNFFTPSQWEESPKHRRRFEDLMAWGANPETISQQDISEFLQSIQDGLMLEKRGKPAHTQAYIAWSLSQLANMIRKYNRLFETKM